MKKSYKRLFFALLLLVGIGAANTQKALAEGGQVTTNGVVGFYEESSTEPTHASTSEPSTATSSSKELPITKPKGRLPSTGELIQSPYTWVGVLLAVGALILFRRAKKNRSAKEGNQ
ncbi:hypothetical protein A5821_002836 [Enterococcus sp. 7F3_DIV0205]|uniref:Gram-positive cocci surface proteins LPxTG domain-containing protein n=1 Tax=Candidatus Enterococcus palustris TaxID=1834189 RepID=A0AAQ3WBB4_9ENTE|nr:LPXTG cell wall anchor domain-containing protein [Enterococcus sp. 7F3_DIV0205]OTN83270.1 hypothetical protein A5821_003193 [Enterococcus sp. 7F3_DIV0205]